MRLVHPELYQYGVGHSSLFRGFLFQNYDLFLRSLSPRLQAPLEASLAFSELLLRSLPGSSKGSIELRLQHRRVQEEEDVNFPTYV